MEPWGVFNCYLKQNFNYQLESKSIANAIRQTGSTEREIKRQYSRKFSNEFLLINIISFMSICWKTNCK